MTNTQNMQKTNEELLKELTELQFRLDELKFYEENNFEKLFDATMETESKIETIIQSVSDLITRQADKRQNHTNAETREAWFHVSLSKMNEINNMLDKVIVEVNEM